MYKVLVQFTDLQDNNHKYLPGETYPRAGLEVSMTRLKELSTDKNRRRRPMIELVGEPVKAEEKPKKDDKADTLEGKINKPEMSKSKPVEKPVEEKPKPKRGRRKKDAE